MIRFASIAILAACTAEPATPPSGACAEARTKSDLAWIQANVLTGSCALSGSCHRGAATQAGGLSLEPGRSHASLVGKAATTQPGWTRVVAGAPDRSYLLASLGHVPGPMPKGGFMPQASPPLCVEKLDAIERWIAAGAPP